MTPLKDSLFSIVCVTYNQENLIKECLDSIAGQDYRRIELIVCDDCSTDQTPQVVEGWLEDHQGRFKNILFLKNEENLGISAAHDRGLRCTTGKYLKYIAGDDILALLPGFPEDETHCAHLASRALNAALDDAMRRRAPEASP